MRGVKKLTQGKFQIRIWQNGKETKRIVEANSAKEANTIRLQLADDRRLNIRVPTLRDYCVTWLEIRKPRLKHSTVYGYARHLETITDHEISDMHLTDIRTSDVQRFVNSLSGGWSSVDGVRRVMRTMFEDVRVDYQLAVNPAARIFNPKDKTGYTEEQPNLITSEQLRDFVSLATNEKKWFAMIYVGMVTGLRFSELSALQWCDLHDGYLRVVRSQYRGVVAQSLKTRKNRTLPVTEPMSYALEEWKRISKRVEGWIWLGRNGALRTVGAYNRVIKRVAKRVGVPHRLTSHGLRRTFNNEVRRVTDGVVLRSLTGHSTASMSEHYSQVALAEKQAAVKLLEERIG